MPSRRTFLIGAGTAFVGASVLLGTDAFSSVNAERTVAVNVADDADALLGIEPGAEGDEYVIENGTIEIDVTGTNAGGQGVNENAITAVDQLLEVTNNGTTDVAVGFDDAYAIENGDYTEPPGGWTYAVNDNEDAAVVVWASPLPADLNDPLSDIRPELRSMGFLGSATLVDENSIRSEVEDNSERTVSPGESLNMGLLVDTRDSTISNPIPTALDDTITIYAEATGASGVGGGGGGNPSTQTGTDWNELRTKLDNDGDLTLQNDLDASTPGFQQVDPPKEYSGTLDGDGHEIRNITVNANGDDVGLFKQITSGGEVKNISFKDITINSDTSGRRNGFIGYIGPNCTLENVSAKNVTITGGSRTGFIGKIDSDVNNVRVENVDVEGTDRVGGLIGHNQFQTVENASVTGGTVTGDAAVGGLVGDNQEKINNSSVGATVVEGDTNIGGLVGINRGDGEIYRSYATGDVNGGSRVGGLAGSNQGSSGTVSITESYATGDVDGADLVGGIVGVSWGNPRAIVEKSYAIGDVNGSTGVGGLVGRDGPPSGSSAFNGDVEESYATGTVSGTSNVGGIIGEFFSGTVANVYWDQNTTGQTSSPGGGTDLTTSQMQGPTATQNMLGFDFSGTWTVVTNPDGYPILQWQ